MRNLNIAVFPHIVNALLVTSIFSAGNTYTYCATRSLYGLAIEGRAPKFLRKCTRGGVPVFCFAIVMIFPFLSFLQVSSGSSIVLTWLVNLVTAGGEPSYSYSTSLCPPADSTTRRDQLHRHDRHLHFLPPRIESTGH